MILPMVALRDLVVFPHMTASLDVGRKESLEAVRHAASGDRTVALVMQKDLTMEEPSDADLYTTGVQAKIRQMLQLPGGVIRIMVEGICRIRVTRILRDKSYMEAEFTKVREKEPSDPLRAEAYRRALTATFMNWLHMRQRALSENEYVRMRALKTPGETADFIASEFLENPDHLQKVLEASDIMKRLELVQNYLDEEIQITHIEGNIEEEVRKSMSRDQEEYYLRQKIKKIHEKLGDSASHEDEIAKYRKELKESGIPEEEQGKIKEEIDHLEAMPPMMAETTVARNYLDWVFSLPWNKETKDNTDLNKAQKILDHDHYGLKKIKERILEYLAVRILAPNAKAPIICFVGPPGVGKTSLAASIARAMGRRFVRISLGGIHDEAEIRGHRRTYIGAMPGRFIEGIQEAKVKNPVMLLDEIDKVGNDYRGDPASALLEALDPEQNKAFHDNYIDIPFDFSHVFFIATANTLNTVPAALLDRMEVIELSGYTEDEKTEIAKKYLIPRQRKRNGLKVSDIHFTPAIIHKIISGYTREAGVRNLERTIGQVCRKTAKKIVMKETTPPPLSVRTLDTYLGPVRFLPMDEAHPSQVGRVNGLAWTTAGGEVLDVEAATICGKGHLILTGQMGDVMKESAEIAYTYVRSRAKELGLKPDFYESVNTHVHLPEGAVPKDGPSAGVTMATAMASAYTGRKVRGDTAMTGEITLTGEVLPIGGVKEKVLAAYAFGVKQVLLPEKNRRDLDDVPESVRKKIHFVFIRTVDQVFEHALMK